MKKTILFKMFQKNSQDMVTRRQENTVGSNKGNCEGSE